MRLTPHPVVPQDRPRTHPGAEGRVIKRSPLPLRREAGALARARAPRVPRTEALYNEPLVTVEGHGRRPDVDLRTRDRRDLA